jgi:hypothetical protein
MIQPAPHEAALEHVPENADVIVPMANGEPVGLLDALEASTASRSCADGRSPTAHAP